MTANPSNPALVSVFEQKGAITYYRLARCNRQRQHCKQTYQSLHCTNSKIHVQESRVDIVVGRRLTN